MSEATHEMSEPGIDRDELMRRTGPLYPGLVAVRSLTVIPLPWVLTPTEEDVQRSGLWFPAVGAVMGLVVGVLALVLMRFGMVPALAGVLALAAATWLGRAQLEAGVAGGVGLLAGPELARDDTSRSLYVGLAVGGLFAVRGVALLGTDTSAWVGTLVVAAVTARWAPILLARLGEVRETPGPGDRTLLCGDGGWTPFAIASGVAGLLVIVAGGVMGLFALILAGLIAFGLGMVFQRRSGGLDRHAVAAAAAVCELAALACMAAGNPAVESPWVSYSRLADLLL